MIRISSLFTCTALAVALGSALLANAQQIERGQGGMQHNMPGGPMQRMQQQTEHQNMENMNSVQKEFHASMQKMNQQMMEGMMEADPGKSWLKQMIAHHQGAVEMSEIVLKYSKDDDVRREARKTKEENEKGIKDLQVELRKKER